MASTYTDPYTYGTGPETITPTTLGGGTSSGLDAATDSAYDFLVQMLRDWNLEALGPAVLKFLQDGYTQDQVSFLIQDTPEYKARFSGNEKRRAAGIAVLSPRDYLAVEDAYRQILSSNGMPLGFYDSPSDFADWIGKDVSPQEISSRVNLAVDAANKLDSNTLDAFTHWYGVGANDLAAFFLDQDRALPHIQKIAKAVSIGGGYGREGLSIEQSRAEQLAGWAGDRDTGQLVSAVAGLARRGEELSNIYGGEDYRLANAEGEVFQGAESERRKRLQLAAMEEGTFSGQSGVGKTTLSKGRGY